jgi:hypothetical protein
MVRFIISDFWDKFCCELKQLKNWIYKIKYILKLTNFAMVLKKIANFFHIKKLERKEGRKEENNNPVHNMATIGVLV